MIWGNFKKPNIHTTEVLKAGGGGEVKIYI